MKFSNILERQIKRCIGTTNKTFVEIGVGNGLENNTLHLLLQGWNGLWVDGALKFVDQIKQKFEFSLNNGTLKVRHAWVQRENVNELIAEGECQ